jgi:hypothetical protein
MCFRNQTFASCQHLDPGGAHCARDGLGAIADCRLRFFYQANAEIEASW